MACHRGAAGPGLLADHLSSVDGCAVGGGVAAASGQACRRGAAGPGSLAEGTCGTRTAESTPSRQSLPRQPFLTPTPHVDWRGAPAGSPNQHRGVRQTSHGHRDACLGVWHAMPPCCKGRVCHGDRKITGMLGQPLLWVTGGALAHLRSTSAKRVSRRGPYVGTTRRNFESPAKLLASSCVRRG